MQFAIMAWTHPQSSISSIFGIIDKNNPGKLPMITPHGHWSDFTVIHESRFKFAAEAKKAIAANGYYLMGAGGTVTEAFGGPPPTATP
jgi:hypothetical protein